MEKSIRSEAYWRLAAVLRDLRREAGLRQVDVAATLGEPQNFVSRYESGDRRLDIIELARVAEALGTSLQEILRRLDLDQRSGESESH